MPEHEHADVLLVTVTVIETKAVLDVVNKKLGREVVPVFRGRKTYYDLGLIGGARVWLVRSEMGNIGAAGSELTIYEAIQALSPAAIIMVGIAFGADEQKQAIGDILVSLQIQDYESQRLSKNQITFRGSKIEPFPQTLNRFRDGETFWRGAKLRFGLILSGQKLVDDPKFKASLLKQFPDAIGGDMEGLGLYSASILEKTDWIMVKAICDWADGNKNHDKKDEHQELAATNAAEFAFFVLERGGFANQNQISKAPPQNQSTGADNPIPDFTNRKASEEQKLKLINLLTDFSLLHTLTGRNSLAARLPQNIRLSINESSHPRIHNQNIIEACSKYLTGYKSLLEALYNLEGETMELKELKDYILAELADKA